MKTVNHLLNDSNSLLLNYRQIAQRLSVLTELLQQALPNSLIPHCQVASYKDGCLTLQTTSAVWATQLRYTIPDIQPKLQNIPQFKDLIMIRYFVASAITPTVASQTPLRRLSAENAQLMLATAEHIPGNLGEALRRMARFNNKS